MPYQDLYKFNIYQIDAFTSTVFGGNPAAVIPLSEWLPGDVMQKIANENNLPETAFFIPNDKGFQLRWFTPTQEVDLCGHATLAAAHVLWYHLEYTKDIITFFTNSGPLEITRLTYDYYKMLFPTDKISPAKLAKKYLDMFDVPPIEVFKGFTDYLLIFENQSSIVNFKPDFQKISKMDARGLIISTKATSKKVDFVSRCFYPQFGINEDPVTGSAHTTLVPYWSKALKKNKLVAHQLSHRKGELSCRLYNEDLVEIAGSAKTYLIGEIFVYL
jgi:PhzF family phenazine biosynthesis protein